MPVLHPRNRHGGRYDFEKLTSAHPELSRYVVTSPRQESTIDFSNSEAVKALNCALLKLFYRVEKWDVPQGYLCPPIPGRADYVHHVADLLASLNGESIPTGKDVRVLDVGTGANCIYPLIGHSEYGWSFVGSEVDSVAVKSAQEILNGNVRLKKFIEIRMQTNPQSILKGLVQSDERFNAVMCNPPFHSSLADALAGTKRKWTNLGKKDKAQLNFGGKENELCYPGGESAFILKMIEESVLFHERVGWFSSLVSKETTLHGLYLMLKKMQVKEWTTLEMSQGQKKSRVIAWRFR